jgi:hypothetical protein
LKSKDFSHRNIGKQMSNTKSITKLPFMSGVDLHHCGLQTVADLPGGRGGAAAPGLPARRREPQPIASSGFAGVSTAGQGAAIDDSFLPFRNEEVRPWAVLVEKK